MVPLVHVTHVAWPQDCLFLSLRAALGFRNLNIMTFTNSRGGSEMLSAAGTD